MSPQPGPYPNPRPEDQVRPPGSPPPSGFNATSVNGAPIDVGPQINIQTDGAADVNIDIEDSTRGEERRITVVFTHGLTRTGPLRLDMPPEHAREVARHLVECLGLHECLADWGLRDVPPKARSWVRRILLRRKERS